MDERAWLERLDRQTAVLEAIARAINALADEIRDQRDEIRVQTQAQLRMLDRMSRFDPGDATA